MLDAGIDVYTTVNIQHLESLNDIVVGHAKIHVKENTGWVFDEAEQVKLIDIEPILLITRLKEGKIYKTVQAERALKVFLHKRKLIALREIALRRMADKVNRQRSRSALSEKQGGREQGEYILTCISNSSIL